MPAAGDPEGPSALTLNTMRDSTSVTGTCALCHEEKPLRKSHFIPNAVYIPKKLEFTTRKARGVGGTHLKRWLLCTDCERRFDENGESEVLKWIAPKAKVFPLYERIRLALPLPGYDVPKPYSGRDLAVETDKFAYFALSILWRAAVCEWPMPDGTVTVPLELGSYQEPMREFLLGQTRLPVNVVVLVLVCTDETSRRAWYTPSRLAGAPFDVVGFLLRGVLFRVFFGADVPNGLRHACCTSARKCLFHINCQEMSDRAFISLIGSDERS